MSDSIAKRLQNAASTAVRTFTFKNDEITYIEMDYARWRRECDRPICEGKINFKHDNVMSSMEFTGDSFSDLLQKMADYCRAIQE